MVASTRKVHKRIGRSMVSRIREESDPRKGIFFSPRSPSSTASTRVLKTIVAKNKTAKRQAREDKLIADEINDQDIYDNIGLYIDADGKLASTEGAISRIQCTLLIKELRHKKEFANDDYHAEIIQKAIQLVRRVRKTVKKHHPEMNSLEEMMAGLSTGKN